MAEKCRSALYAMVLAKAKNIFNQNASTADRDLRDRRGSYSKYQLILKNFLDRVGHDLRHNPSIGWQGKSLKNCA